MVITVEEWYSKEVLDLNNTLAILKKECYHTLEDLREDKIPEALLEMMNIRRHWLGVIRWIYRNKESNITLDEWFNRQEVSLNHCKKILDDHNQINMDNLEVESWGVAPEWAERIRNIVLTSPMMIDEYLIQIKAEKETILTALNNQGYFFTFDLGSISAMKLYSFGIPGYFANKILRKLR